MQNQNIKEIIIDVVSIMGSEQKEETLGRWQRLNHPHLVEFIYPLSWEINKNADMS